MSGPDILQKHTKHPGFVMRYKTKIQQSHPGIDDLKAEIKARDKVAKGFRNMRKGVSNELFIAERKRSSIAKDESITDSLTGLNNRRFLLGSENGEGPSKQGELESRFKEAVELGHNLTCLMIDLNDFKNINDSFGHLVGDEYMTIFAEAAKSTFRSNDKLRGNDTLARYGGDEFLFVLPDIDAIDSLKVIERFLDKYKQLQERIFSERGIKSGTLSIGVVDLKDNKGQLKYRKGNEGKYEEIITQADNAMYLAKSLAKASKNNEIIVYGSEKYVNAKNATPLNNKLS